MSAVFFIISPASIGVSDGGPVSLRIALKPISR